MLKKYSSHAVFEQSLLGVLYRVLATGIWLVVRPGF